MYYKMVLDSGHVGAGKTRETVRYFSGKDPVAMFGLAAGMPRMKGKDKGTGVKLVQPVTREEYIQGIKRTNDDEYFKTRRKKKDSRRKKEVLFH